MWEHNHTLRGCLAPGWHEIITLICWRISRGARREHQPVIFIRVTHSKAEPRRKPGLFLSFTTSSCPSYQSFVLSLTWHKGTQSHVVCFVVTPQLHFQDDCPCVMKQSLSRATDDYMASRGDQSVCKHFFFFKESNRCSAECRWLNSYVVFSDDENSFCLTEGRGNRRTEMVFVFVISGVSPSLLWLLCLGDIIEPYTPTLESF